LVPGDARLDEPTGQLKYGKVLILFGPAYADDSPMVDADLQALIDEASLAYAETERGRAGEKDRRHQPPLWDWRANREERRRQAEPDRP
jgi:hypothetical protein